MRSFCAAAGLAALGGVRGFGSRCGARQQQQESDFPPTTEMPADLRVALLGDQGLDSALRSNPVPVLEMVREWGAQFVVHDGDFDYHLSVGDPQRWVAQIDSVLGEDFPYFASIGNHDVLKWEGESGYRQELHGRMQRQQLEQFCRGEHGVNMVCHYKGLAFVLSGVGTRGQDHVQFMDDAFSHYDPLRSPWKLVSWHKNQKLMQIGSKRDEVGWEAYDMARAHGAIISTGHEHSYCRSYTMSDIERQVLVDTNNTVTLKEGQSFVHVTGLAGKDIRSTSGGLQDNPWWAAWGASDSGVDFGALLCTFNVGGDLRKAHCEFRTISGEVIDDFDMVSELGLDGAHKADEVKSALAWEREQGCRARFLEWAVDRTQDDSEVDGAGEEHVGEEQLLREPRAALLRFRGLELERGTAVEHAHLQVMGAEEGKEESAVGLRISLTHVSRDGQPQGEASLAVEWAHGEWEKGEVWVSPDLSSALQPLLDSPQWRAGDGVRLRVEADQPGARTFFSSDASPCLAPTLSVQVAASQRC